MGRSRRRSGIPRSTGTSREPSPSRYSALSGISPSKSRSRSISGMFKCSFLFVHMCITEICCLVFYLCLCPFPVTGLLPPLFLSHFSVQVKQYQIIVLSLGYKLTSHTIIYICLQVQQKCLPKCLASHGR